MMSFIFSKTATSSWMVHHGQSGTTFFLSKALSAIFEKAGLKMLKNLITKHLTAGIPPTSVLVNFLQLRRP